VGTAFDITEKKRLEQEAREHTALLQALVANSPYGIMVGGKDHRIQFSNPAFQRMFQYAEEEVVGRDPDDLIGLTENTEATDISARVLKGDIVHTTAVRRRKDGSKVDVEFHAVPLIANDEFVGCFGIYQDITERIKSEAKLRTLRDRLTRVQDEERAHTARELHDDIAQRLALLAVQLAQLQKDARVAAPALDVQLEASRRLAEEVCADAQRISHRLHPAHLALLGLTRALSGLCESMAKRTEVEIDFDHDQIPRLPPEVNACLYRIAQEAIQNDQAQPVPTDCRAADRCAGVVRLSVGYRLRFRPGRGRTQRRPWAREHGGTRPQRGRRPARRSAIGQGTRIEVSIPTGARRR
jgi:PAS domain S-box-containing protein